MRFAKSKGQTATAMPGEFSPWLLLLAASLGWKQAMLWQQAMISKGFQEKCPQEQDLHWLRHRIEGWQWLQLLLTPSLKTFAFGMEAWVTFDFQTTGQVLGLGKLLLPGILAGIQTVAHILKLLCPSKAY